MENLELWILRFKSMGLWHNHNLSISKEKCLIIDENKDEVTLVLQTCCSWSLSSELNIRFHTDPEFPYSNAAHRVLYCTHVERATATRGSRDYSDHDNHSHHLHYHHRYCHHQFNAHDRLLSDNLRSVFRLWVLKFSWWWLWTLLSCGIVTPCNPLYKY